MKIFHKNKYCKHSLSVLSPISTWDYWVAAKLSTWLPPSISHVGVPTSESLWLVFQRCCQPVFTLPTSSSSAWNCTLSDNSGNLVNSHDMLMTFQLSLIEGGYEIIQWVYLLSDDASQSIIWDALHIGYAHDF